MELYRLNLVGFDATLSRKELLEFLDRHGTNWVEDSRGDIYAKGMYDSSGSLVFEGEKGFDYDAWREGSQDWYVVAYMIRSDDD